MRQILMQSDGSPWANLHKAESAATLMYGRTERFHYPVPVKDGFGLQVGGVPPFFEQLPGILREEAAAKLLVVEAMFEEHAHRGVKWWRFAPNFGKEILLARNGIVNFAQWYAEKKERFDAGDRRVKPKTLEKYLYHLANNVQVDVSDPKFLPINPANAPEGECGKRPEDRGGRRYTNKHQIGETSIWLEWSNYTDDPSFWQADFRGFSGLSFVSPEEAAAKAKGIWLSWKKSETKAHMQEFDRKTLGGMRMSALRDLARTRCITGWEKGQRKSLVHAILESQVFWLSRLAVKMLQQRVQDVEARAHGCEA